MVRLVNRKFGHRKGVRKTLNPCPKVLPCVQIFRRLKDAKIGTSLRGVRFRDRLPSALAAPRLVEEDRGAASRRHYKMRTSRTSVLPLAHRDEFLPRAEEQGAVGNGRRRETGLAKFIRRRD